MRLIYPWRFIVLHCTSGPHFEPSIICESRERTVPANVLGTPQQAKGIIMDLLDVHIRMI